MIRRQRLDETQYRHGAKGREPLAPPGAGGDHVHYQPLKRAGIGVITSRKQKDNGITCWELLAFRLSEQTGQRITVQAAKRAFEEGLIR